MNGKIYIGIHKQQDLGFDGYLGSGVLLHKAIKKYGENNFSRKVLFKFDTLEESRIKEKELVTEEFIARSDTYNISVGGTGGNTMCGYSDMHKSAVYKKIGDAQRGVPVKPELYEMYKTNMLRVRIQPDNRGRVHSEESRKNMAMFNHMNAKRYITNGTENALLLKTESPPEGWWFGRTLTDDQKFKGHSAEVLNSMSKNRAGCMYATNGTINVLLKPGDEIPPGFYQGLTKKMVKRRFANNGQIEKQIPITETLLDGWSYGRIKRNK